MSVPVTTESTLQVKGITLMAPPSGNYTLGVRATAIRTVPAPTTAPTPSSPTTLTIGQWILDPSGIYVLILENSETSVNKGLSLYRVVGGNPTSGSFEGDNAYGPVGGDTGVFFLAQADGNACVYPKDSLTPTWHANSGTSGSAQYLFVQENGCFVMTQCNGVWNSCS